MTQLKKLTGAGMSALAATQINGDVDLGATAAGNSQVTAYPLKAVLTRFDSVAAGAGAILPVGAPSDDMVIANHGANTLTVYPPIGGALNNGTANAGVSVNANAVAHIFCVDGAGLNWDVK